MKRIISALLIGASLLALCACGEAPSAPAPETEAPAETEIQTPAPETEAPVAEAPETETPETEAPQTEPPATPTPDVPAPEAEVPADEPAAQDAKTVALGLIDHSVDELYAAVGEPVSSDYAPSCLGPGEDGNLYYDGFTVYTYREDGSETISYVE